MKIIGERFCEACTEQKQSFADAVEYVCGAEGGRFLDGGARHGGIEGTTNIGSLGERILHLALKYFFEPDNSFHEIKCGKYHADIFRDGEIIEIQTGSCAPLAKKIAALTKEIPVTVVHPMVAEKKICWVDPESGEMAGFRKSPKRETVYEVFRRIYPLRELCAKSNISFVFPVIACEEYRLKCGRTHEGKRHGAKRMNRIPTELIGYYRFRNAGEFACLMPEKLAGEKFTVRQLSEELKIDARKAHAFARTLCFADAAEICEKSGRADVYRLL